MRSAKRGRLLLPRWMRRQPVVVNVDDPTLVAITDQIGGRGESISGSTPEHHCLERLPHAADAAACRALRRRTCSYRELLSRTWATGQCTSAAGDDPRSMWKAANIVLNGDGVAGLMSVARRAAFDAGLHRHGSGTLQRLQRRRARLPLPSQLGVAPQRSSLGPAASFKSPFGRDGAHQLSTGGDITLALVKNPVGFNEVLRMLTGRWRAACRCRP